MRRLCHRLCLLGLLLLALTSLQTATAQTGNPQHDALAAKPQAEQRAELHTLIRATGSACTSVVIIYYAGQDANRTAYWDGRCQDGPLYRAAFAPPRWAQPSLVSCGALVPPPAGGPCFRPVQQAVVTAAAPFASADEPRCRASCASQPSSLVNNCAARCLSGVGVEVGTQAAAQLPPNSRFGVAFATDAPLGAWGFGNGSTDRLNVNVQAARACQQMAGRTPCKFLGEMVNTCGALAQAISRHPSALVITSSLTTYLVNRWSVGTGASAAAAEAAALADCRRSENPNSQCRIVISGC